MPSRRRRPPTPLLPAALRRPDRLRDLLLVGPGLLLMGVFVAYAASEGGTSEVTWYPGAVFVVVLLAVMLVARGLRGPPLPFAVRLALGFLAAFVAWSFLSITWADDRGAAWADSNMALLYLATFALCAVWPWSGRAALIVLGVFGVAIAIVGTVVLSQAGDAQEPATYLIKRRFAEPVGYPNGNAALFLIAAWVLLVPASRAETPWAARGLALGAAGVLVDLALLCQSRGSALACAATALVVVAVAPNRLRVLVALAAVGGTAWLVSGDLFRVYDVAEDPTALRAALRASMDAVVLSFVILGGAGASVGLLERYAAIPQHVVAGTTKAFGALTVLACAAGAVVAVAAMGNPITFAQDRWDEFAAGDPLTDQFEGTRLTAGVEGRSRDDFWSVALDDFGERPLTGMGAGNFAVVYARDRSNFEEPIDPHGLPVRVLTQTGIVGALLFLAFLGAALAAAWRARRGGSPLQRAGAAAGVAGFAYWFIHTGGDWLWTIPATAGPAFACLGLAAGLAASREQPRVRLAAEEERGGEDEAPAPRPPWAARLGLAGIAVGAVVALATLVPPWLSATALDEAAVEWRYDRERAYDLLERSRGLNPLSDRPDLVTGVIASRLGDRRRAREAFARAVERGPLNWYGHQQLGIEDALAGRRRAALDHLRRARELNPLEETTRLVLNEVRQGRRPDPVEVRTRLLNRVCSRVPSAQVC